MKLVPFVFVLCLAPLLASSEMFSLTSGTMVELLRGAPGLDLGNKMFIPIYFGTRISCGEVFVFVIYQVIGESFFGAIFEVPQVREPRVAFATVQTKDLDKLITGYKNTIRDPTRSPSHPTLDVPESSNPTTTTSQQTPPPVVTQSSTPPTAPQPSTSPTAPNPPPSSSRLRITLSFASCVFVAGFLKLAEAGFTDAGITLVKFYTGLG